MVGWLRARVGKRWFPWSVVALLLALAPAAGVIGWLSAIAQYRDMPPPCYGIGWGCSLAPSDAGVFLAILWTGTVVLVAAALAITELFWRPIAVTRSILLLVILVFGLGLLLLIAAQGLLTLA